MIKRNNIKNKTIFITAGGTGGHIFPALLICEKLKKLGYKLFFITDIRGKKFLSKTTTSDNKQASKLFEKVLILNASGFAGKTIYEKIISLIKMTFCFIPSIYWVFKYKPNLTIGFGGYVTLAPVIMSKLCLKKTIIHSADTVIGLSNKILINFSNFICTSFKNVKGIPNRLKNKIVYTGLPIKDIFFKYRKNPYPKITPTSKIQILITGGSLGAQILTDTIPYSLSMLPKNIIKRLNVIHQVQYDKIKPISDFYKKIGIKAEVSDFFKNIPELLNKSNLFIGRSGASTVVEVGTIACPAIFIPLMHKDKHQVYNAKTLEKIGGAKIILQSDLSIDKLSREIETLINKDILTQMYNNLMKIETIQASDNIIKLINKAITK